MVVKCFLLGIFFTVVCAAGTNHSDPHGDRNPFTLTDNKYGDLLIAISDNVAENYSHLIPAIKDSFTEFSRDLFVATKHRAYLGNVKILVPKSWSRNNESRTNESQLEVAGVETFGRANFIVVKPGKYEGRGPATKQQGRCGEPGEYVKLSPEYLIDRRQSERNFGPIGKTILHEFGHLRWGLFDEYGLPDEGYKQFYHSTDKTGVAKIEAVKCSKMIPGNMMKVVGGKYENCERDPVTSLPEKDCIYVPHPTSQSTARASLMFWHFLNNTDSFCDNNSSDPLTLHSDEAPSKHNRLCGGKSQWEVMRDHADFKDNNNLPVAEFVNVNTTPTFHILHKGETRIVFIIDVSGSMSYRSRLKKASQAVAEAIKVAVKYGSYVAIVTFESTARTAHQMIRIDTEADRQSLIKALPNYASGGTGIGAGLLEGLKILENFGETRGGKLILLSDGQEGYRPFIMDVLPNITRAEVIVDTVLLSNYADLKLVSLATQNGGHSFFASDSETSTSLLDAFLTVTETDTEAPTFVKVFGEVFATGPNKTFIQEIVIDDTIGNKSEFLITWLDSSPHIDVNLTSPSGLRVQIPSLISTDKSLRISIPEIAEAGRWKLEIQNNDMYMYQTSNLQLSVTSHPRSEHDTPITLTTQLSQSNVDFNDPSSIRLIIYATLAKGYVPVVNAEVYAIVESGKNSSSIRLLDNGAGADTTKEDGVYSGYFLDFVGNGGYSVTAKAFDNSGKAQLKTSSSSGGQNAVSMCLLLGTCSTPQTDSVYQNTSGISRVATGGSFQVANQLSTSTDLFEPSSIVDLTVMEAFYENSTVTLEWTAVGDDLDKGQASWYDLRMHTNSHTLRQQFSSSPKLNQSMLLLGKLTQPKVSGDIERFTVRLDKMQKEETFFFAIKAVDDVNKAGDVSNIVSVAFTMQAPSVNVIIQPLLTSSMPADEDDKTSRGQDATSTPTNDQSAAPTSANEPVVTYSSAQPKPTPVGGTEQQTTHHKTSTPKPDGAARSLTPFEILLTASIGSALVFVFIVAIVAMALVKSSVKHHNIMRVRPADTNANAWA